MKICIIDHVDIKSIAADSLVVIIDGKKPEDINGLISRKIRSLRNYDIHVMSSDWKREGNIIHVPPDVAKFFLPGRRIIFHIKNKGQHLGDVMLAILRDSDKSLQSTVVVDLGVVEEYQEVVQAVHSFLSDSTWVSQIYFALPQLKMQEKLKRNFGMIRIQTF